MVEEAREVLEEWRKELGSRPWDDGPLGCARGDRRDAERFIGMTEMGGTLRCECHDVEGLEVGLAEEAPCPAVMLALGSGQAYSYVAA